MKQQNITRIDLSEFMQAEVGLSQAESLILVDDIIRLITGALKRKESVKIRDFATFEPYTKAERTGRNPRTKEEYPISKRVVISFIAAAALKKELSDVGQV